MSQSQAAATAATPTLPPPRAEVTAELYHKAWQFKRDGRHRRAQQAFTAYLRRCPQDCNGWLGLGLVLKEQQFYRQAAQAFERYLELRSDVTVRNVLVTSLWHDGQYDAARRHGLLNLQDKDHQACAGFQQSAFSQQALRAHRPVFDPEQPQRNIIAFSLWGDDPVYVSGAIVNAQLTPHVYPGWTARFYCDLSVPEDARRLLAKQGAQVQLVQQGPLAHIKPMWRFMASDDPGVDFFLCRDADSRLNVREATAVHAWLQSGQRFHLMRDHIFHMELMLAGMWGGTAGVLPPLQECLLQAPGYFDNRFGDQAFLKDLVWPLIKADLCTHDSVYGFPDGQDFPPGFRLPGRIHVGGAVKQMPHWSAVFTGV